ncbi:glycosyltransferase [uncultured Prochlorococcus sp.]|uniref:glycosyltransferase n=1 Tax=uncultured Prochlorococcus sp. TaxID=159733 RepID=UPI0025887F6A|nr:glycosyltransferase [uncultured Prochlorococcus sp.]
MRKKTIFCIVKFYLPGSNAGGPIRSISNLVNNLNDQFDFSILTLARDAKEKRNYPSIKINKWNNLYNSKIFYIDYKINFYFAILKSIIKKRDSILYLNSFFSINFTLIPLLISIIFGTNKNIIIATRGELSSGALGIKKIKKRLYILFFNILTNFKTIRYQATSNQEKNEIFKEINAKKELIYIAPNYLSNKKIISKSYSRLESNNLRLIYLSRITPKKNLLFALEILRKIKYNVDFDIYGIIDDSSYWLKCKNLMENMPSNINISYKGSLKHELVEETFRLYDLFFFPTLGENFGHVIPESLSQGTAVLTSDRVPWKRIERFDCIWLYNLEDRSKFIKKLNSFAKMGNSQFESIRRNCISCSEKIYDQKKLNNKYKNLFNF